MSLPLLTAVQNKDLRDRTQELEHKLRDSCLKNEKKEFALVQKQQNLENEKKNLLAKLKVHEEEKKQLKDRELQDRDAGRKLKEMSCKLHKTQEDHEHELEKVHRDYQLTLKNMKALHLSVVLYLEGT